MCGLTVINEKFKNLKNTYYIKFLNCRLLEDRRNKQNSTTTEMSVAKDKDKHITTTEKITYNQTTADEKENTVIVVLIVLVLLLIMLLIGVVIVYNRKTGKMCYKKRCLLREGIIIKNLTFLTTSSLSLSHSLVFARFQTH